MVLWRGREGGSFFFIHFILLNSYMYVSMYMYIYMFVCMYVYICMCMYVYICIYVYVYIYIYMHVHVYYACICVCIYGVYIWMYMFKHCVYKRACVLRWSYDHVHIEKENKSSEKKRNTVKISYSCLRSISSAISSQNRNILSTK